MLVNFVDETGMSKPMILARVIVKEVLGKLQDAAQTLRQTRLRE